VDRPWAQGGERYALQFNTSYYFCPSVVQSMEDAFSSLAFNKADIQSSEHAAAAPLNASARAALAALEEQRRHAVEERAAVLARSHQMRQGAAQQGQQGQGPGRRRLRAQGKGSRTSDEGALVASTRNSPNTPPALAREQQEWGRSTERSATSTAIAKLLYSSQATGHNPPVPEQAENVTDAVVVRDARTAAASYATGNRGAHPGDGYPDRYQNGYAGSAGAGGRDKEGAAFNTAAPHLMLVVPSSSLEGFDPSLAADPSTSWVEIGCRMQSARFVDYQR